MSLRTPKERIGMLDQRITLQQYTEAVDEYGEPVKTYADLAEVWAKVEYTDTGSNEEYDGAAINEFRRVDFTVRHRTDISAKDRVEFNSEYYDIRNLQVIGRNVYMKLITELRK